MKFLNRSLYKQAASATHTSHWMSFLFSMVFTISIFGVGNFARAQATGPLAVRSCDAVLREFSLRAIEPSHQVVLKDSGVKLADESDVSSVGSFDLRLFPGRQIGKESLAEVLAVQLAQLGAVNQAPAQIENLIAVPPDFKLGQFAFPTFTLAKALRQAPPKIAAELAARLNQQLPDYIKVAEAAGPYVNFHYDFARLGMDLVTESKKPEHFQLQVDPKLQQKVSLEFSQPNTHKALHVGHLRNMVLGESVARLIEASGHEVDRVTYPGDLGTHIAKVLWYIQYIKKSELPKTNQADWLGKMYVEAANYEKENEGDPSIKAGISRTLRNIEERRGEDYDLYRLTREWSIDEMQRIYAWLGIRFDRWFCESECDMASRALVLEKYEQKILQKSSGAIGLDLKDENLGFVMMLKSDGSGLYLTKDLELLRQKSLDPKISKIIVVVDDRQKLHFRQVFRSAQIMGIANASNAMHLAYGTVNDKEGKAFSSRTLSGLTLSDLRSTMEARVMERLQEVNGGSFSTELAKAESQKVAQKLVLANLKFGFLRISPETSVRFDMNEWLSEEGNTGTAHINLRNRLLELSKSSKAESEEALYSEPKYAELIYQLSLYRSTLTKAIQRLDPAVITTYVFELSKLVKKLDEKSLVAVPKLSEATAKALDASLKVLGIDI